MTLVIFKIIYYVGLAVFCIASLLALRHMNRFSYLGRAVRPVMILYIVVCLAIIIFIQISMTDIDWNRPLFSRSVPSISSYETLDSSVSKSSSGIIDFIKSIIER